jgi:hypothetical protein
MRGSVIIPRNSRDFEVAHRFEDGLHRIEVSIGSSFNELYWDNSVDEINSRPSDFEDLKRILIDNGAEWLVLSISRLANGTMTASDLAEIALARNQPGAGTVE